MADKVDLQIAVASTYDDAGVKQAEQGLKQVEDAARQAEQASAKAAQTAGNAPAGGGQTEKNSTSVLQQEQQATAAAAEELSSLGQAGQEAGQQVAEAAQQTSTTIEGLGQAGQEAGQKIAEAAQIATAALQDEQAAAAATRETLGSIGQGMDTGAADVIKEHEAALLALATACDTAIAALKRQVDAELSAATAANGETESANKQVEARQRSVSAAQTEKEKSVALTQAMKLETLGEKALIEELKKLASARKAAAAAGNVENFQKLTEQYKQAKTALQQLNTQASLNKIALMGQAQAGLQFAQGLGSLASQVTNGTGNLASMATQAMALGMALKAGLGPIGWIMAALQGLSMLWSYFSEKQKKAAESMRDAAKAAKELQETLQRLATENANKRFSAIEEMTQREVSAIKRREGAELASLERRHAAYEEARKKELETLKKSIAAQMAEQEKLQVQGQISDTDLEAFREEKELELQAAERTAREMAEKEEAVRVGKAASIAEKTAAEYREQYDQLRKEFGQLFNLSTGKNPQLEEILRNFDKFTAIKEESAKAIETINKEMEAEKANNDDKQKLTALRRKRAIYGANMADAERRMADLTLWAERTQEAILSSAKKQAVTSGMNTENLLRYGAAVLARKDRAEEALEAAEAENAAAQDALRSVKERVEVNEAQRKKEQMQADRGCTLYEELSEEEKIRVSKRELREIRQREKEREEEWTKKQEESYNEQERWLREQLRSMKEGSELYKQYTAKLRQVTDLQREDEWKAKQQANYAEQEEWLVEQLGAMQEGGMLWRQYTERLRTVQDSLQQEAWVEKQRESLEAQEAWLQETISHLEEGSQTAKKWTAQLRAVKLKGVQDELNNIEKQYQVTGDYARQDNRTQAQIHAADKKALQQRKEALEKLKASPDTDAATLKAINQKIKETNKQAAGLEKNMAASARAALQQVEAMKPQKLKASNKLAQSKLDALANAYSRMAKMAARAASKGDTKAVERYQKAMQKNVLAQERITKYSGQAASHYRKTTANLQAIAQGTSQEEKGMSSQQRRRRQIEKALGVQQKNTQKAATEAGKTAKAQEQLTKATKKQSQKTKNQTSAEKIENLNGEISSLKAAIRQCEQSMSALKTNLGGLVSVTGQVSSAAASAAQTAANAVSKQQKSIERIQKQIDRINSKI